MERGEEMRWNGTRDVAYLAWLALLPKLHEYGALSVLGFCGSFLRPMAWLGNTGLLVVVKIGVMNFCRGGLCLPRELESLITPGCKINDPAPAKPHGLRITCIIDGFSVSSRVIFGTRLTSNTASLELWPVSVRVSDLSSGRNPIMSVNHRPVTCEEEPPRTKGLFSRRTESPHEAASTPRRDLSLAPRNI
jgi:hypothetical protein